MNDKNKNTKSVFSSFEDLGTMIGIVDSDNKNDPKKETRIEEINPKNNKLGLSTKSIPHPTPNKKKINSVKKNKNLKNFKKAKEEVVRFNHDIFYSLKQKAYEKQKTKQYKEALQLLSNAIDMAFEYIKKSRGLGEKKKTSGDVDGALKEYREANKVFKKLVPVFYSRGVLRKKVKDFSGAIEDYSFVIKYHPNHKPAYIKRIEIRERLGEFDNVISDLNEIIKLDLNNKSFYYKLGDMYLLKGDLPEAIKDYNNALSKDNNNPVKLFEKVQTLISKGKKHLALAKIDFAVTKIEKILVKFNAANIKEKISDTSFIQNLKVPLSELYCCRADILQANGNCSDADENYSLAIKFDSNNNFLLFTKRAQVRASLKKYTKAIDDYNFVVEKNKNDAKLYSLRGELKIKIKLFDSAIEDFFKSFEIEPFNVPLNIKIADAYFCKNDFKNAEKYYDKFLEFKKNNIKVSLKKAFIKIKQKEFSKCFEIIKTALEANEITSSKIYTESCRLYENNKLYKCLQKLDLFITNIENIIEQLCCNDELKKKFKKNEIKKHLFEKLGDTYFLSLILRSKIKLKRRNYDGIEESLSEVLSYDSVNKDALKVRAKLYNIQKKYKLALKDIKKVIKTDHKDDEAYFIKATIHDHLDEYESAIKDYKKAIKINPKFYKYHTKLGVSAYYMHLYEVSVFSLKKSLAIHKQQEIVFRFLALNYLTASDKNFINVNEGLNFAKKAIAINKSKINLQLLAIVYSLKADYDKSVEYQELAMKKTQTDEDQQLLNLYKNKKPWSLDFLNLIKF